MSRTKLLCAFLALLSICSFSAWSQQSTITTTFSNNATHGQITFNFQNANAVPVMITGLEGIVSVSGSVNVEAWYRTSAISSSPGVISAANGWVRFGNGSITGVANTTTTTSQTFFNNLSLVVPANSTYAICVSAYTPSNNTGCLRFSALSTNTTTQNQAGGCTMINGYNVSFAGPYNAALTFTPAAFIGSLTFTAAQACSGTPAPGNTLASDDSTCIGRTDSLSLSNPLFATGVIYQWQKSTDNVTFTDIANANNSTHVATITGAAYYRCRVSCGSNIAYSTVKRVTIRYYQNCYCIPIHTNSSSSNSQFIYRVTINTLNYESGSSSSPPYYTNIPEAAANTILFAGNTYNLSVIVGIGCSARVWFDWNLNGTFENSESTLVGVNAGPTIVVLNTSVAVPPTAFGGKTRMRMRTSSYSNPLATSDACTTAVNGETEDYTIDIIGPPLAINLKNINARSIGNINRVTWETLMETGGDHFILEKSTDGQNYSSVTIVQSKGRASTYLYDDKNPTTGINFYRLKIVDANGKYSYSPVARAVTKEVTNLIIETYPNPVGAILNIAAYGLLGENSTIQLIDMAGKTVLTQKLNSQQTSVNMSNIAPGLYILKYTGIKTTQTFKINKQ